MSFPTEIFLQGLLTLHTIHASEAQDLIEDISAATNTNTTLEDQIKAVNSSLQPLGRHISKVRHPQTEEWIYVNTRKIDAASTNNIKQLGYEKFISVIDQLFQFDKEYFIVASRVKASNASDITQLCDEGWIEKDKETQRYTPAPRLIVEGEEFLAKRYEETLHRCLGCNKLVIYGRFCSKNDCTARVHRRCYAPYWQQQQLEDDVCPKCSDAMLPPNNGSENDAFATSMMSALAPDEDEK